MVFRSQISSINYCDKLSAGVVKKLDLNWLFASEKASEKIIAFPFSVAVDREQNKA